MSRFTELAQALESLIKQPQVSLRRSLNLPLLVLYGLGTTVGAGIYALIGEIAAASGYLAPWSFLLAAGLALLTAVSFATLSNRYPRAAGIALYIQQGLNSLQLARIAGLLAIMAGLISSAALLNGFVGYAQEFVDFNRTSVIVISILCVGAIATIGIAESVAVASIITVVEVVGLLWVTWLAAAAAVEAPTTMAVFTPPTLFSSAQQSWLAISSGAVLAFYAYIGFEDMVEVAEEVKNVRINMPWGIILTLIISTALYLSLIIAALLATSPEYLARSNAPLSDLFRAVSHQDPRIISTIGMFAIINGALIQIIMATRVLYGLASRGQLPSWLARVHPRTQTPILATILATTCVAVLALIGTTAGLAEVTSLTILTLFAAVNCSLWRLEVRRDQSTLRSYLTKATSFTGAVVCAALVIHQAWVWFQ